MHIRSMLSAGAAGYILKNDVTIDLPTAIRGVARGERGWCSHRVVELLWQRRLMPLPLTKREREILRLAAHGKSNRRIAEELGISVRTVGNHMASSFAGLDVHSRAEAVAWAWEHGLVAHHEDDNRRIPPKNLGRGVRK